MDHRSLTAATLAAALAGAAEASAAAGEGTWLPTPASNLAGGVDGPFLALYALGAFAVVAVAGLALAYARQFRRRDPDDRGAPGGRPSPLLLGLWVLGAAGLGLFAFVSGLPGFLDEQVAPYGAYTINVTARQGPWDFTYPGGHVADTLHVPTERPVRLVLRSEDVVHGLSVPALRVNRAVLPDRSSEVWFEATAADTFALRPNVYDGPDYAAMQTAVVALVQGDFDAWLRKVSDIFAGRTMVEVGELLYATKGCKTCHSLDGSRLVGPSFKDLYGHSFELTDGRTVTADDAYIRESILDPNAAVVAGYQPVMTPFAGQITDKEIEAITEWLKTMSDHGGASAADDSTGAAPAAADTTGGDASKEEKE